MFVRYINSKKGQDNMKKKILTTLVVILSMSNGLFAGEYTLAPDGTYVGGSTFNMAPDGSFVGGSGSTLAPDGTYVGE